MGTHLSTGQCTRGKTTSEEYSSGECCTKKLNWVKKKQEKEHITLNLTPLQLMLGACLQSTDNISSPLEAMTLVSWSGEAKTLSFPSKCGNAEDPSSGCPAPGWGTSTEPLCHMDLER